MVIAKSNKSHREKVMTFENKVLDNYITSFLHTEQFKLFNLYVPNGSNTKKFFEVGAAPGLYGIIFRKYFNYIVGGIEYTDSGFQSIQSLFEHKGEDCSHFIKGDFFELKDQKFDLVFSGGFVEHFDDYIDVIERHIKITKKDGKIIIIVPNYHFYYKYFQGLFYPGLMKKQHNTKIMNALEFKRVFQTLENSGKIKIEFLGGIEKANFGQLVSKNSFVQKFIYALHLFLDKTRLYRLLPKDTSSLIVIANVL